MSDMGMENDACGRSDRILHGMGQIWNDSCLTDFTLTAGQKSFRVHRAFLAATSDYFFAMLTGDMQESRRDSVELKAISAQGLEPLLQFVYTGKFELTEDNVIDVVAAAHHLQIGFALRPCVKYMTKITNVENCVDIYNASKLYLLKDVDSSCDIETETFNFICWNFHAVIKGGHQRGLDAETMVKCLTKSMPGGSDAVRFSPEIDIFSCIIKWLESDANENIYDIVRFSLMSTSELDTITNVISDTKLPCQRLVNQALEYHSLPMHLQVKASETLNIRIRNRPCLLTLAHDEDNQNTAFFILTSWNGCPPPSEEKETLTWLRIPQMDHNIHENVRRSFFPFTSVVVNDFLIICGQSDQGAIKCYIFDPRTFLWAPMAAMEEPRSNFPLVECDGCVFAMGGVRVGDPGLNCGTIERYSFDSGRWENVGEMGEKLRNYGAHSLKGKIYLYGGRRDDGTVSQSMYTYEPATNTWSEHWYRFPLHDYLKLYAMRDRIYAADASLGEISTFTPADRHNTWWAFFVREQHLIPLESQHAVFTQDGVFFISGQPKPHREEGAGPYGRKCCQVTINDNYRLSGNPVPQPDYPEGWHPCVAAAIRLPWHVLRHADNAQGFSL